MSYLMPSRCTWNDCKPAPMNREQWYAAYILKQFHVKLMASGNRMYANQKGYTTVKIDGVQAMVLVNVLTSYPFTPDLNQFLSEVAKIQEKW